MPSPFHHPTPPDPAYPDALETFDTEEDAEYAGWHTYAPLARSQGLSVTVCPVNPSDLFWKWSYGVYTLRPSSPRSHLATRDVLPY